MVTYFSSGTSFMVANDSTLTISGIDSLCGHKVSVEVGTTQLDDATAQKPKCIQEGKPKLEVTSLPDQAAANLALASGRVEVVLADSPVNAYAAKQSNGRFKISGPTYGTAPYGIVVPKTADYQGFDQALLDALKKLMTDGVYLRILQKWGIQAGAITDPVINGAVS